MGLLKSAYTIVLTNQDILSRVCGTNDANLRLIEDYLGVSVFTRGNELFISLTDNFVREQFQKTIDLLAREAANGVDLNLDTVRSLLNAVATHSDPSYIENFIQIPGGTGRVYPKSPAQARLIQAIRSSDMVFAVGPAGSGKTYLAVAEALYQVLSKKKKKIVLTRPVVEAGENLGFLPGDLEQKIHPYLRPLYDSIENLLSKETLYKMNNSGMKEIAPLAYMRGRTLSDSIILLDEAQNTTREQMKMFLTRMGEGSQVIVTGDITQIDLPRRLPSGLQHALEVLKHIEQIQFVWLTAADVVRNSLVKKIVEAYEEAYEKEQQASY